MYFVRRAFSPLLITAAGEWPAAVVRIVSDLPVPAHGCNVTADAWEVRGGPRARAPFRQWSTTVPILVAGGVAAAIALPPSPGGTLAPHEWFLRLRVECESGHVSDNDFFPGGNFSLSRALLGASSVTAGGWDVSGTRCTFVLRSDDPALFVVLDSGHLRGVSAPLSGDNSSLW
jgi:hypothetical protein